MDIVSILDKTFFMGEGRSLLRGVCQQLGEPMVSLGAPGGTRMFVFFRLRLMKHFKAVVAGIHTRIAWRREKHGARSLRNLMDVGRRLTDVGFVVFAVFFESFLPKAFEPFSQLSQKAVEPMALEATARRSIEYVGQVKAAIHDLKRYLTVATLLRQHCSPREVMFFMWALCYTPAGRALPGFLGALMRVLYKLPPEYKDVILQTDKQEDKDFLCLGPHCQCLSREPGAAGPFFQRGQSYFSPRVQFRPRARQLPRTAVNSFRKHLRDSGHSSCSNLTSRWVLQGGRCPCTWRSRCFIPQAVYDVHEQALQALCSAEDLASKSLFEMTEMLGSVGVNKDVLEVRRLAHEAFDWRQLLARRPGVSHLQSFFKFYEKMAPVLQNTLWPEGDIFASVRRTWNLSDAEKRRQYKLLVARVRQAAFGHASVPASVRESAKLWFLANTCTVRPVIVFNPLHRLLAKRLGLSMTSRSLSVALRVSLFLGEHMGQSLPKAAYESFEVDLDGPSAAAAQVHLMMIMIGLSILILLPPLASQYDSA
jgi:hypothetical protein